MKFLKIDNNQGFFLKDKAEPVTWTAIDKIEKGDLMKLLDFAMEDDFEMDPFDENTLANKAHQIIYKGIYEKLNTFLKNKDRFKDETEAIYKEALEKYQ